MSSLNPKQQVRPGPADYRPSTTKASSKGFFFAATKRNTAQNLVTSKNMPGPGRYNVHKKYKGPSYSIAGKKEVKKDKLPGPADYTAKDVSK